MFAEGDLAYLPQQQQQAAQQNRFAGSNMGVNLQPVRCHLYPKALFARLCITKTAHCIVDRKACVTSACLAHVLALQSI